MMSRQQDVCSFHDEFIKIFVMFYYDGSRRRFQKLTESPFTKLFFIYSFIQLSLPFTDIYYKEFYIYRWKNSM